MPADVRQAILDRITNDDPDGARALLDGVDALLSPEARAEWRQRVAWSYYIENRDPQALAIAQTVDDGSGAWVAEGDWIAGLAAWRMGDCATAGSFVRARGRPARAISNCAAPRYYWASRAALRCRHPERSAELLRSAAADRRDALWHARRAAARAQRLPDLVDSADFTEADWKRLKDSDNVRVAIALAEIGRDELASEVLIHEAKIGDPRISPRSRASPASWACRRPSSTWPTTRPTAPRRTRPRAIRRRSGRRSSGWQVDPGAGLRPHAAGIGLPRPRGQPGRARRG